MNYVKAKNLAKMKPANAVFTGFWRSRWDSNSIDFVLIHQLLSKQAVLGAKYTHIHINRSISSTSEHFIWGQIWGQFLHRTF